MNRYRKDGFGLWAVCLKETGEMIFDREYPDEAVSVNLRAVQRRLIRIWQRRNHLTYS